MIFNANVRLDDDTLNFSGQADVGIVNRDGAVGVTVTPIPAQKKIFLELSETSSVLYKNSKLQLKNGSAKLIVNYEKQQETLDLWADNLQKIVNSIICRDEETLAKLREPLESETDDDLRLISPSRSRVRSPAPLFGGTVKTYGKKNAAIASSPSRPGVSLSGVSSRTKMIVANANRGSQAYSTATAPPSFITQPNTIQKISLPRPTTTAPSSSITRPTKRVIDEEDEKTEAYSLEEECGPPVTTSSVTSPTKMPKIPDSSFYQKTAPHNTANSPFRDRTSFAPSTPSKPATNPVTAPIKSHYWTSPASQPRITEFMGSYQRSALTEVRYDGMKNVGNTCYMNAVLQCLTSLPGFTADLQKLLPQLPDVAKDSIFRSVLNIITEKRKSDHGVINPRPVKVALEAQVKDFRGYDQQDAHEFLVRVLDLIEREVHAVLKARQPAEISKEELFRQLHVIDPSARSFFSLVSRSHTCLSCQGETVLVEPCSHLSLDVPCTSELSYSTIMESWFDDLASGASSPASDSAAAITLQDLLDGYFQTHRIDKQCEKCNKEVSAQVKVQFTELPAVLILHLKRFTPTDTVPITFRKITEPIKIDLTLDLKPHSSPDALLASHPAVELALPEPTADIATAQPESASEPKPPATVLVLDAPEKPVASAPKPSAPPVSPDPDAENKAPSSSILRPSPRHANNAIDAPIDHYAFGSQPTPVIGTSIDDDDIKRALEASMQTAKEEAVLRSEEEELQSAIKASLQQAESVPRSSTQTLSPNRGAAKRMAAEITDESTSPRKRAAGAVTVRMEPQLCRSPTYKLHSFVCHRGDLQGGHYVSDVFDIAKKRWRRFNDATSTTVLDLDIFGDDRARTGYLFFFVNSSLL